MKNQMITILIVSIILTVINILVWLPAEAVIIANIDCRIIVKIITMLTLVGGVIYLIHNGGKAQISSEEAKMLFEINDAVSGDDDDSPWGVTASEIGYLSEILEEDNRIEEIERARWRSWLTTMTRTSGWFRRFFARVGIVKIT